ncbi:DNA glycosylase family protein [Desulfoluna spongiiphila]|uniref:hypothetical protein n=1 Tax=Desulfoluna spongiiphila TaxID=419481 RepID=UPI001251A5CE|nr:hypothetical protein [Desulfoluna spongiiphila]VVS91136.1 dna glycosylase [Desulfoluna spongiiphila]
MTTTTLHLNCPTDYLLETLCLTHGWRQLRPFHWEEGSCVLTYVLHTGARPVDLLISQTRDTLAVEVTGDGPLAEEERAAVKRALTTMLALDRETTAIKHLAEQTSEAYANLVTEGAGRLLIAPTVWENAVKALLTTNCSWALTRKMAEKICSDSFTGPAPSGRCPFPSPAEVNRYSAEEIKSLAPVGYRGAYLKALAHYFVATPGFEALLSGGTLRQAEARERISALKGFGEYARIHLMTLLGFYGEIPVDSVVRGYMKAVHGVTDIPSFLETQYGDWGAYRWWKFKMESMLLGNNFP